MIYTTCNNQSDCSISFSYSIRYLKSILDILQHVPNTVPHIDCSWHFIVLHLGKNSHHYILCVCVCVCVGA